MSANDTQVAGSHYKGKAIQPWDYIVGNDLGYLEGNVIKYVSRWKDKGGVDDLRKARHYLDKLIEVQTAAQPCQVPIDAYPVPTGVVPPRGIYAQEHQA